MLRLKYEVVNDTLQNKRSPHFNGARGLLYEHGSHLAHSRDIKPNAEPRSPFIDYMLEETLADEHRSALTPEFAIFATARNRFTSARNSHIGHNFPRVRACAQIKQKSSQPFAFQPFSLRIAISFSFVFAQAYASLEHCREDTRKYSVYYSFCLSSPFFRFSTFSLVQTCIVHSYFVLLIVLSFPFRVSWFLYLILHICMYIRLFQRLYSKRFRSLSFSHLARTRRTRISLPFTLRTSAQPSAISQSPPLLLGTRLAPFAHPHTRTASAIVLFCFGHGQRSVSASSLAYLTNTFPVILRSALMTRPLCDVRRLNNTYSSDIYIYI
jgi:hypothetical protein